MDKQWFEGSTTLFLDRDGVINNEISDGYVLTPEQFVFMPNAKEAIALLSKYFKKIIVVTNQRCIGKGLLTEEGLAEIHQQMLKEITQAGGKIDAIYFAKALENEDVMRKPNAGMAIKATNDYQEISLQNSIMVGNKKSDMLFAQNAGTKAVFVTTTNDAPTNVPINLTCLDLWAFALWYDEKNKKN
jgi:D-glycero-D-manno-heptose 1,7-bisphosphate phosphatase